MKKKQLDAIHRVKEAQMRMQAAAFAKLRAERDEIAGQRGLAR